MWIEKKIHNHLGIKIELRNDGKVEVDMIKKMKKVISDFSEEIKGIVKSPVANNL